MRNFWASCALLGLGACSASSGNGGVFGSGGAGPVGGAGGASVGGAGGVPLPVGGNGGQSFGGGFNPAPVTDAGDPDAPCQAVTQQAEKRLGGEADIIWVLDNSLSMFDEAAAVQNNMNAFSQFIAGTGIDVRVVVISGPANLLSMGVCVGAPLGSGQCPADSNPPIYQRVDQLVQSNDALFLTQATFDQWRAMLRPGAAKTFVYVTDDDAQPVPSTTDFVNWVNSQPEFQGATWRVSGIFCQTQVPIACFAQGTAYTDLVNRTGGIAADLPSQQWDAIFQQLGDAVVADAVPVDCEWTIPAPKEGEELDPNLVNVRFTPASGIAQTIYGLDSQADCTAETGGWYYDDPVNPTRVIACPSSCTTIQADDQAKIDVLFGCVKEVPPIPK